MKTALITGANGFIGSHLTANLASAGWNVIGTMRKERDNAADARSNTGKIVFTGDIGAYKQWDEILGGVEAVVHLAALAHDTSGNKKWTADDYMKINAGATLDLARAAAKTGVKRFIFISTIKVNGETTPVDNPFDETSPAKPSDPYGASKLMAENGLWEIAEETGMEIVVIRPPLVYGRGVKGNMGALIDAINRKRLAPAPAVKNLRSFVYAGNLADAILVCMEHPQAAGHTFVVSDGEDISTINLIRLIAESARSGAIILPAPKQLLALAGAVGDAIEAIVGRHVPFNSAVISKVQSSLRVDSAKIRRKLGWSPPFTLKEGIVKTVGRP
ncbi:UDP-glucose 4-epimerase [hydrothermal vent metagenome]|uniref:UDP-glucose 4-epimerase n=1 Tax=hydrothermal vent metagenome TaxID=652676 RepID=A0A3B1BSN3_9ZZZZ